MSVMTCGFGRRARAAGATLVPEQGGEEPRRLPPAPDRGRRRTTGWQRPMRPSVSAQCRRRAMALRAHRARRPSRSARSGRRCRARGSGRSGRRAPRRSARACGQRAHGDGSATAAARAGRRARRAHDARSAGDAALTNSAAIEGRAQANNPQAAAPVRSRWRSAGGVDLALEQRARHGPARMPLRHDRADPGTGWQGAAAGKSSTGNVHRRARRSVDNFAGRAACVRAARRGRRPRRADGGQRNARCAARLREPRTRSKSAETTRRGSGAAAAQPPGMRPPCAAALRRPGACDPWRAGR